LLSKFCALFYHEILVNSIHQSTQQGEKKRNKERGLKSEPKKKKSSKLVAKGTKTNHVPEPPLITRSISER
jgi:hypothetical protein